MKFNKELWIKIGEFSHYMNSKKWKALRKQRMKIDSNRCVLCKTKKDLLVHHLTYDNLYHEKMEDLMTLCKKRCHNKIHKISPPKEVPDFVKRDALEKVYEITDKEMVDKMWEEE